MNLFKKTLQFVLLGCMAMNFAIAQDLSQAIPLDPTIKTGVLPNGLKYFIRKNAKPEKRVELRLAVNAGSMMEDDDQLGLAHFTEHMCFNGTKNFPKNELVNYLQSQGVRFGADLNAYTSFDETVYMLPIPSDKEEIVDKGLQILEDWAHNVTFENLEIDKERGVVIEEWRTGRGAGQRMLDKYLPVILKGSRYADRLPIGTKESLQGFKYEVIKRFYKDWYRPDLMAVIVVGDIDVDKMEQKIKTYFGRLEAVKNPRERKNYEVPNHPETLISIVSDKEANNNSVQVYYKHDLQKLTTVGDYRQKLMADLYSSMINSRLDELTEKPEPPFIFGFIGYSNFFRSKDVYQLYAQVGNDGIEKGLKTLLTEDKKLLEYGFTASEFERAKTEMLTNYEKQFNERNKTNSENYVGEYVNYFLEGVAAPGIEYEFNLMKQLLPAMKLDEVNALSKKWITKENRVVVITAADKPEVKLPTEVRVREILAEIEQAKVEKYEDKVITEPLMAKIPTAGKVVKETQVKGIEGVTELVLSNGVKVLLKPTTFKDDEIRMSAFSMGGTSLYPDSDKLNAENASQVIGESGIGNFSNTDLQKLLTGKNARVSPYISQISEGFNGNTTPKDVETMLQLTHLYFTAPRKDEATFKSFVSKNKSFLQNLKANPQIYFQLELNKILTQNHPRASVLPEPEDLDKINLQRAIDIYKERFANAGDFTFTFVGNFEVAKIKPLLETYLGSLPTTKQKENFKDLGIRPPKGVVKQEIKKGQDPKSQVSLVFTGDLKNTKDGYLIARYVDILRNKLIENLREDKGGVYSPGANSSISKYPYSRFSVNVGFGCAPENVETLVAAVFEEIKKIQANGPTAEDLNKVKEAQRRELEKNSKENNFWVNRIQSTYYEKRKPATLEQSKAQIEAFTAQDIQRVAKAYTNEKNFIKVALVPEVPTTDTKNTLNTEQSASGKTEAEKLTAEQVIDKYLNAIGGKTKLAQVKAMKMIGTMDIMGMKIGLEISRKSPDKFLLIQKLPMGEMKQVVNGEKGFMEMAGQKQEMPAEQAKAYTSDGMFFELDYAKNGTKAEMVNTEVVNDKNTYQIKFTKANGKTELKWYDVTTGLIVKTDNEAQEVTVEEYTEVQGIKLPLKAKTKLKAQGAEGLMNFTTVEINPTLDDAIFGGQ